MNYPIEYEQTFTIANVNGEHCEKLKAPTRGILTKLVARAYDPTSDPGSEPVISIVNHDYRDEDGHEAAYGLQVDRYAVCPPFALAEGQRVDFFAEANGGFPYMSRDATIGVPDSSLYAVVTGLTDGTRVEIHTGFIHRQI